ncbi:hypothetical protein N7468_001423 [Penicillium chermesinum]|uniref:Uncharacterized protein n=1 Tax=Penicillium chermesinum TaxID=63820 RepID=A0A9W9PGN2_9EURO|nr:uncharacterized protein N7468_001423 [Penicillium chermesinum]KAJ5246440.1 hypothetical protein N7468_001423 [Penicillium chermesinum]
MRERQELEPVAEQKRVLRQENVMRGIRAGVVHPAPFITSSANHIVKPLIPRRLQQLSSTNTSLEFPS